MPRSMKSRTEPRVVDSFSVTPAEVEAQMQRQDEERNKPAPVPQPKYQPIVREVIRGMKPGPLYGQVVPIPQNSYKLASRVTAQSGPGVIQLQLASTPDGPWHNAEPGDSHAGKDYGWKWRKFLRWMVTPQSRKEFVVACEVEFLYDADTYDTTHKPRYNPDIRAFELVTGP
jgi:hypothetical protein